MLKKLFVNEDLFVYAKVSIFEQIKLKIYYKLPFWAIPERQHKIILIDNKGNSTEIDL